MNVLSGWPPMEEFSREQCLDVLASNLNYAAAAFDDTGTTVLTEAVNNQDRPGYLINRTAEALDVIDRAGHANLKLSMISTTCRLWRGIWSIRSRKT